MEMNKDDLLKALGIIVLGAVAVYFFLHIFGFQPAVYFHIRIDLLSYRES